MLFQNLSRNLLQVFYQDAKNFIREQYTNLCQQYNYLHLLIALHQEALLSVIQKDQIWPIITTTQ